MLKFAANLDWLFTEVPFLDRFEAAAAAGFRGVEFMFPYNHPAPFIRELLDRYRLEMVMFNVYAGEWSASERGFAAYPDRTEDFSRAAALALEYAQSLRCRQLHVLAGLDRPDYASQVLHNTYVHNLRELARKASPLGVTILVEAINQFDMPGYFVKNTEQAASICQEIAEANIRIQLDLYHCQMSEGGLSAKILALKGLYAHVQVAGVPGRHEPSVGEINYPFVLSRLEEIGYQGWIGCEYRPLTETRAGFAWLNAWASENESRPEQKTLRPEGTKANE